MPVNRDAIGARGERIAHNLLTRFHGRDEPLFQVQFLGDKYPAIDFFVELVGAAGSQAPFFFVQVKTTMQGYAGSGRRLKVRVDRAEMHGLVRYPAPTYIIGVDALPEVELGFILAATVGGAPQLSSLPTIYPLSELATLQALYDEVLNFWTAYPASFANSRFT